MPSAGKGGSAGCQSSFSEHQGQQDSFHRLLLVDAENTGATFILFFLFLIHASREIHHRSAHSWAGIEIF